MLAKISGWDEGNTSIGEKDGFHESKILFDTHSNQIVVRSSSEFLTGEMMLYDLRGSLLKRKKITDTSAYFDASLLSDGLYIVILSKDTNRLAKKIACFQ